MRACSPAQALARPSEEELEKTRKETQEALDRVVTGKLTSVNPSALPSQPGGPTYIKYTPSQQGAAYASGAGQRIIKMQVSELRRWGGACDRCHAESCMRLVWCGGETAVVQVGCTRGTLLLGGHAHHGGAGPGVLGLCCRWC